MKVLITGKGTAGSWKIRGEQLGAAIGATVEPNATLATMRKFDVVIVVKRATDRVIEAARQFGGLVIWDALDFWAQPGENGAPIGELVEKGNTFARRMGAAVIVCATEQMATDFDSPYWLPHHGWDRGRAAIREFVQIVAYEGDPRYLDTWGDEIAKECARRGWSLVVNRAYLAADVVIAFRGGEFDTEATRRWKSNVKLANAQIAGLPFVGQPDCGYLETRSGVEWFVPERGALGNAFDEIEDRSTRLAVSDEMFAAAPRLADVAARYKELIACVAK